MRQAETSGLQSPDPEELLAFPLSPEQQRMWEADREQPGNSAYNAAYRWDLRGILDEILIERTFNEIVRRYDVLRTKFALLDGIPRQIVTPNRHLVIVTTDLSNLPAVERNEIMDQLCEEEAKRSFDLEAGPLIRVGLLRMSPQHHVLMLTLHHIICDGWSIRLIMEEMRQIYPAYATGQESPLPDPPPQYRDYVVWQADRIERGDFAKQLEYWKERLAGYQRLDIGQEVSAGAERSNKSAIVALQLPTSVSHHLKQFSHEIGGTMFGTSLAALMILLQKYSGRFDISVGSPVAARNSTEIEGLIGLIVNPVVFRVATPEQGGFREFARRVKNVVWEAMANQDVPFAHVLAALRNSGEPCPHPFYSVNFVCHRAFGGTASFVFEFSGISASTIPSKSQGALYDLNFFLIERENGWRLSLEYRTELYSSHYAQHMIEEFKRLLEAIGANPDVAISEIPISPDEGITDALSAVVTPHHPAAEEALGKSEAAASDLEAFYQLPAGVTQERFWLLSKIAPNQSIFNMPASVRIAGPLSVEILEKSLQFVVDRHESLRTRLGKSKDNSFSTSPPT